MRYTRDEVDYGKGLRVVSRGTDTQIRIVLEVVKYQYFRMKNKQAVTNPI